MRTEIILTVEHTKEIPDLLDKIANRIYVIDNVQDVTATIKPEPDSSVVDMEASE